MELADIKGLGKIGIEHLKKLGINSKNDLVSFYPFRYEILKRSDLNNISDDDKVIIDGVVASIPNIYFFNRKMDRMTFKLNTGFNLINITIFNRRYLKDKLGLNTNITVIGKYDRLHNTITASDIRLEKLGDDIKIEPIYHTTYGISNKKIENYINCALSDTKKIENYIPNYFMEKYRFLDKMIAVREIHHPTDLKKLNNCLIELR